MCLAQRQEANPDSGQAIIVSTLLLIVGILMLITAFRTWRKEDDPDAPPPKWMAAISGLSALKAFGMGALLVAIAAKQWVFTLSAIGTIGDAGLGQATNVILFLFYAIAAQSLVLAPVAILCRGAGPSGQIVGRGLEVVGTLQPFNCDCNFVDFWPVLSMEGHHRSAWLMTWANVSGQWLGTINTSGRGLRRRYGAPRWLRPSRRHCRR